MPQVWPRMHGEPLIWRTSWASRALPMAHQFLRPSLEEQLIVCCGGPGRPPMTNSARQPLSTQSPRLSTPQGFVAKAGGAADLADELGIAGAADSAPVSAAVIGGAGDF